MKFSKRFKTPLVSNKSGWEPFFQTTVMIFILWKQNMWFQKTSEEAPSLMYRREERKNLTNSWNQDYGVVQKQYLILRPKMEQNFSARKLHSTARNTINCNLQETKLLFFLAYLFICQTKEGDLEYFLGHENQVYHPFLFIFDWSVWYIK